VPGPSIIPSRSSMLGSVRPALTRGEELSRLELSAFIRSFGVPLSSLTGDQVLCFLAARSLLREVEDLSVPVASERGKGRVDVQISAQDDAERPADSSSGDETQRHPSRAFSIGRAGVKDLAKILPQHRCYSPRQLLYLLANGKLTKKVHLRDEPKVGQEERREHRAKDLSERGSPTTEAAPRAYVLLDVSQSMNGAIDKNDRYPDQRGVVGRGLALAFLLMAQDRGSQLHFRPFSSQVGERMSAREPREIASICREMFSLKNGGTTALQKALEVSVQDLAAIDRGTRIDVMLITDGLSSATKNPFEGRFLHTFLLGDACAAEEDGGTGIYEKLQAWSASFRKIEVERFGRMLEPRESDLKAFADLIRQANGQVQNASTREELDRLSNLMSSAEAIVSAARRYGGEPSESLRELAQNLSEFHNRFGSVETQQRVADTEQEYDRMCALYEANLPGGYRTAERAISTKEDVRGKQVSLGGSGSGKSNPSSLSELVRAIAQEATRIARRVFRRQ